MMMLRKRPRHVDGVGEASAMRDASANAPRDAMVELNRSQTRRLADALDPIVAAHGSRDRAARALGLPSKDALDRVLVRRASARISRDKFLILTEALRIDVSGWEVKDTR